MILEHTISLDMLEPGTPPRIQVKQGDTTTHSLNILLFAKGEPWLIPDNAVPVIRWSAFDPETGESARGIYDSLPDGTHAWQYTQNELKLVMVPQMFVLPGLVQADVAFTVGEAVLATFNFEFYVNPAPVNGTQPQLQDYYKVSTLEQLNAALEALQTQITQLRQALESLSS